MLAAVTLGGVRRIAWITEVKWELIRPDPLDLADLNLCELDLAVRDSMTDQFLITSILVNVLASKIIAERWEKSQGGNQDDNYVNAVKHCTWSCEMTQRNGEKSAWEWGEAHECNDKGVPKTDASSHMDRHNNEAGRFYGKSKGDCLKTCKFDPLSRLQHKP